MNDRLTISTAQLLALFPDEAAARHYIESRRWPSGIRCPVCASDRIGTHSAGMYRCYACKPGDGEPFTVRSGTVMERRLEQFTQEMFVMLEQAVARVELEVRERGKSPILEAWAVDAAKLIKRYAQTYN